MNLFTRIRLYFLGKVADLVLSGDLATATEFTAEETEALDARFAVWVATQTDQ